MDSLNNYYKHFITSGNVSYVNTMDAGHTMPTDNPINKNACSVTQSPYISNCHFDGAGAALNTIYPKQLKPRNTGTLTGQLLEFSQGEFFGSGISTAETGYVYVPVSCASGTRCRLHISFHGR